MGCGRISTHPFLFLSHRLSVEVSLFPFLWNNKNIIYSVIKINFSSQKCISQSCDILTFKTWICFYLFRSPLHVHGSLVRCSSNGYCIGLVIASGFRSSCQGSLHATLFGLVTHDEYKEHLCSKTLYSYSTSLHIATGILLGQSGKLCKTCNVWQTGILSQGSIMKTSMVPDMF